MTAQQPHPRRCETCENLDVTDTDDSCPNEEYCGKTGCTIIEPIKTFIEVHGCASHSTRPHTPSPAISMQCEYVSPDNKFCKDMAPRYDGERWLCVKHYDAAIAHAATLAAYDKFLDEVRNEEYENCGYVDMDSVEAVWNSLRTTAQQQEARR
jgi:hypothetical protein